MFPNLSHQCFGQKMIEALPRQKIHKIHVCRFCANFVPEHISPTWSRWWEALWWIWGMRLTWCAFLGNHSEDSLPVIFPILTNRLTFVISTFLGFHKTGLFSNSRQVANEKLWLSLKAGTFLFHSMSTRPNRECQRNITITLNGGMATDHSCVFYVIKLLTASDKISNWDISQKCLFFNQSEKCQNGGIVGALGCRWVPERGATGYDRGNGGVVGTGAASGGTRCTDGLQLHSLPSPLLGVLSSSALQCTHNALERGRPSLASLGLMHPF